MTDDKAALGGVEPCPTCGGTGEFQGGRMMLQKPTCSDCKGSGVKSALLPAQRGEGDGVERVASFLLDRLAELEIPEELSRDWDGHIEPAAARLRAAIAALPRSTEGWQCVPRSTMEIVRQTLSAAKQFIENGVALGFIRMPDPDTPDTAHNTLPAIKSALSLLSAAPAAGAERRGEGSSHG